MTLEIKIKRLPHNPDLPIPSYESAGACGFDLRAALVEDIVLQPGRRELVPTGFAFELPQGHEGQLRPRSGLAWKEGVTVINTPSTIDCDYRGEVKIALVNLGQEPFTIKRGMRMAQMVIAPILRPSIREVPELEESERGAGGFGSTGRE